MDFSKSGIWEGIKKVGVVLLYVAGSAIVAEIITLLGNWKPTTAEFVVLQGVLNLVAVFTQKWLGTKSTDL